MKAVTCLVLAIVLATTPLHASPRWHAGLDLRPELGTHPVRLGGGIRVGRLDTLLVVDPMFWTDGQHDLDAIAFWLPCDRGWGLLAGWRTSAIGVLGGTQLQHKVLVGVAAPLPRLGPFHVRWSFELATLVVKHGGDLPTDTISFASGRDFIDLVNFGSFVTFEVGGAL